MRLHRSVSRWGGALAALLLCACDAPFGLGLPSTQAVEAGAAGTLASTGSFEIKGTYREGGAGDGAGALTTIDLQVVRPAALHAILSTPDTQLEVLVIGGDAYFRGREFLAAHVGGDPVMQGLIRSAGNAWWKGAPGTVPWLPEFTDGPSFRSAFLATSATGRTDHVAVDGIDAIEMSGPRADVFLAAASPHQPLRVVTRRGVVVDGIGSADLRYGGFDRDFGIAAPRDVINFSDLSRSVPIYSVVSVDSSGCLSPCVVRAVLKNLGGSAPAPGPSTVTFTLRLSASGIVAGRCTSRISPDVGYNSTTSAGCTIDLGGQPLDSAIVTAATTNPGAP